jgi:hypothetical protein
MTSTEFAAKYRLLKNVATHGARSFLAQQVELGRMVMVHYLDSEDARWRAATLERLEALPSGNRGKLLEIAEVDGTPVVVTLFISSFKDFSTWLDSVSAPATLEPIDNPKPLEKSLGDFTRIFGKVDETPASATLPPAAKLGAPKPDEDETPTVIMETAKPAQPAAPATTRPERPAGPDSSSSFTAIFGSVGASSHSPPDLPAPRSMPVPPPAPMIPPAPAAFDFRPTAPSPVPQAPAAAEPGEFTQLFQRLSPGGGLTPPPAAAPFIAPDAPKPIAPMPRADAPPPSAPSLGAPAPGLPPLATPAFAVPTLGAPSLGAPPFGAPPIAPKAADSAPAPNASALPPLPSFNPAPVTGAAPPRSWGTPAAPPPIGASVFGNSAPSEFTRMLKPIAPPPPPPVSIQPPAAAPSSSAGGARRSMLPLIMGLSALLLLTVVIVVYFVVRSKG